MPLPAANTPWPPPGHADSLKRYATYDAWFSGVPNRLEAAGQGKPGVTNRPAQYMGGIVGALARTFWGAPVPQGERRAKLHVPLAADIATASSDLLFAKPPRILFKGKATQNRWDALDNQLRFRSRLHEAAEVASAFGGVYLRAGWDETVAQHPLLQAIHPDHAIPEFRWGRLTAVTFWHEVERENGVVWRYLNRHEMVGEGTKVAVEHNALYEGSGDKLGVQRQLQAHPSTEGMEDTIARGLPVLPVAYVPNMGTSREDRGSDLGRSDFEGVLDLFDSLDETFTSWMRDVRLAKGRIIVPSAFLQSLGPGRGAGFDLDREVYEGLDIPPTQTGGSPITLHQFEIRTEQHDHTMMRIIRQAVGTAGYSGQTFGLEEQGGGGEQTATEVNDRRNRSLLTREKKTAYWTPGLQHIAAALLHIDRIIFSGSGDPADVPVIDWPDGASVDQLKLAQTVAQWDVARAASIETKVRALHSDWSDTDVKAEVERIKQESGSGPVEDPGTFTGGQQPPTDDQGDEPEDEEPDEE